MLCCIYNVYVYTYMYLYCVCHFLLWQGRTAVADCWSLNHKLIDQSIDDMRSGIY